MHELEDSHKIFPFFVAAFDDLCAMSICVCVHTWSTLNTVMAALVASLMPQCLTR